MKVQILSQLWKYYEVALTKN